MIRSRGTQSRIWLAALLFLTSVSVGWLGWATPQASAQDSDTLKIEKVVNPDAGVLGSVEFQVKLIVTADKSLCKQQTDRRPVDVVLAIDRSGSMADPAGTGAADTKLDRVKAAAKGFLGNLNLQTDQVALVEFSSVADVVQGLSQNTNAISAAIDSLAADDGTMLDTGLTMAMREFESDRARADAARVIILLTDGLHGGGNPAAGGILGFLFGSVTPSSDPVQVAQEARGKGIRIVTIGMGQPGEIDENMLQSIASQPQDYYHAPAAADLPKIYKSIAQNVISQPVAATNVIIEHAYALDVEVAPDSIQPAGTLSGGKIVWALPEVLDVPITLSYIARPRNAGSFNVSVGDEIVYKRCAAEDRRLSEPPGLPVVVLPPPTPTPTNTPVPTNTPLPTRTPMPTLIPAPPPGAGERAVGMFRNLVCLPNLWSVLIGALILLFIILWILRFIREVRKRPDPKVLGSSPNPCPLWWWWFLPILLLLLGMAFSRLSSCHATQSVYFWRIGSGSSSSIYVTDVEGRSSASEFAPLSNRECIGCHNVSSGSGRIGAILGGGVGSVVLYDLTGKPIAVPNLTASYVALSPDGQRLAISDANRDIQLVDLASGLVMPLAGASDPGVYEEMPAWSPDASEIAFVRGQASSNPWTLDGPCDIYVVPVTGGVPRPLVGASGDGFNYYPAYSPNGQWIAFTRHTTGSTTYSAPEAEIFLVPSVGGARLRLAANDGPNGASLSNVSNSWPTWSLDGRMLAFTSKRKDANYDIFVAEVDQNGNSGPAQLLNGAAQAGIFEHTPYWGTPPEVDPWPSVLALWPWLFLLLLPIMAYLLCRLLQRPPAVIPPPIAKVRPQPGKLEAPAAEPLWQVAPTLIVGVGGTGRWVLTHLKKALRDGGGGTVPENVKFVLLDTSEREQTNLFRDASGRITSVEFAGVSLASDEIFLINQSLDDVVRAARAAPDDALANWFPFEEYRSMPAPQLDLAAGTHGRRPMARAGLIGKLRRMRSAQEESAGRAPTTGSEELFRDASALWGALVSACADPKIQDEGLVRILVVGSLAGGMSGTLFDVAYLARRAARSVAPKAHLEGYLTLPRAFRDEAVNRAWLEINTIAAGRELERFQLSQGFPFRMQYGEGEAEQRPAKALGGTCDWRLFDDVTLFSQSEMLVVPKGKSSETWATTFASMADVITLRLDRAAAAGSRGDYRAGTRSSAEAKQANIGKAVISSAGSYVYRLPLVDILEVVQARWARKLFHVFLNGDLEGENISFDPAEAGMPDAAETYAFKFVTGQHEAGEPPLGVYAVSDLVTGRPVLLRQLQDLGGSDSHGRRYTDYLGAAISLILNGYQTDANGKLKRRSPSIGYAQAFSRQVTTELRKAEESTRNQANSASERGSSLWNRFLLLFGRGQVTRQEWLAAAEKLRVWGDITQRTTESLQNLRQLLMGREGTSDQVSVPGLYSELVARQRQAEAKRKQMDQVAVRRYLWARAVNLDRNPADERNQADLTDVWYQELENKLEEHLGRFYWFTAPEGAVRLGLVLFEKDKRIITLDDRNRDTVSQLANEVHRLAGLLTAEWAKTTRLIDVLPTVFSTEQRDPALRILEETWSQSTPHLRPAVGVNQELDGQQAAVLGIPDHLRSDPLMHDFLTNLGELGTSKSRMASYLKPCKTDAIATTDRTSLVMVREHTQMPLSALPDYQDAWKTYRRNAGRQVETNVESPLSAAVFAAERLALEFERRLEASLPLNQDFRILHPLVVLALAQPQQAKLYAYAFAAGWVSRGAEGAQIRIPGHGEFRLQLPGRKKAEADVIGVEQAKGALDYRIEGLLAVATAPATDPIVEKLTAALEKPDALTEEAWKDFFGHFQEIIRPREQPASPSPAPTISVCVNNHEMRPGAKFCPKCGAPARPQPEAQPSAPTTQFCVKGHEMRPGAKFCRVCGQPAAAQPAIQPSVSPVVTEEGPWRPGFEGEPQAVQDLAAVAALLIYRRLSPSTWSDLVMLKSRKA